MPEVVEEAARRDVDLAMPTEDACRLIATIDGREVHTILPQNRPTMLPTAHATVVRVVLRGRRSWRIEVPRIGRVRYQCLHGRVDHAYRAGTPLLPGRDDRVPQRGAWWPLG